MIIFLVIAVIVMLILLFMILSYIGLKEMVLESDINYFELDDRKLLKLKKRLEKFKRTIDLSVHEKYCDSKTDIEKQKIKNKLKLIEEEIKKRKIISEEMK